MKINQGLTGLKAMLTKEPNIKFEDPTKAYDRLANLETAYIRDIVELSQSKQVQEENRHIEPQLRTVEVFKMGLNAIKQEMQSPKNQTAQGKVSLLKTLKSPKIKEFTGIIQNLPEATKTNMLSTLADMDMHPISARSRQFNQDKCDVIKEFSKDFSHEEIEKYQKNISTSDSTIAAALLTHGKRKTK